MSKNDTPAPQQMEELKQRYAKLHTQKLQAEANKRAKEEQLQELQQRAKEEYGTDDLEALNKKLAKLREENERRRGEYQKHPDEIEGNLAAVEAAHEESIKESL